MHYLHFSIITAVDNLNPGLPEPLVLRSYLLLGQEVVIQQLASRTGQILESMTMELHFTFCILSTIYSRSAVFVSAYPGASNLATISETTTCCSLYRCMSSALVDV